MVTLQETKGTLQFPNLPSTSRVMNTKPFRSDYKTKKVSYDDCRQAIATMKFKSMSEYHKWLETSNFKDLFYKYPEQSYRGRGWVSASHFLSLSENEAKALRKERGRNLGKSGVGGQAVSEQARLYREAQQVVEEAQTVGTKKPIASNFTETIINLYKYGVPDHLVKGVYESLNPTFDDLKALCDELIAQRTK